MRTVTELSHGEGRAAVRLQAVFVRRHAFGFRLTRLDHYNTGGADDQAEALFQDIRAGNGFVHAPKPGFGQESLRENAAGVDTA